MAEHRRLEGAIAAAATPLREQGARLDEDAFGPYADFLVGADLDGVLAFGTNGEAVLLTVEERQRGLELWRDAIGGRALVAAHCGAQTTADTVALAAHAAESGADAVAVIGPPYFKLDPVAQRAHLVAAARACAPLPFYVYEFEATAGYAFDQSMLAALREEAENVVGMKVSDMPWTAFDFSETLKRQPLRAPPRATPAATRAPHRGGRAAAAAHPAGAVHRARPPCA